LWAFYGLSTSSFLSRLFFWGAGTLITIAPLIVHFLNRPDQFESRAAEVFIFSPLPASHISNVVGENSVIQILRYQLAGLNRFLFAGGDATIQYGAGEGFVSRYLWPMSCIGLLASPVLLRRNPTLLLLLFWFMLTILIGGVLTIDPISSPRVSATATLIPLFHLMGISFLLRRTKPSSPVNWSISTLAIVLTLLAAIDSLHAYFERYPKREATSPRDLIARDLEHSPGAIAVAVTPKLWGDLGHEAYKFLAPSKTLIPWPQHIGSTGALDHSDVWTIVGAPSDVQAFIGQNENRSTTCELQKAPGDQTIQWCISTLKSTAVDP
jgi:hypothetical protein